MEKKRMEWEKTVELVTWQTSVICELTRDYTLTVSQYLLNWIMK